jgi:hypothetical protein
MTTDSIGPDALVRQANTPDAPPYFPDGEVAAERRRRSERRAFALCREAVSIAAAKVSLDADQRQDAAQAVALAAFAAPDPVAFLLDSGGAVDAAGRPVLSVPALDAARRAVTQEREARANLVYGEAADYERAGWDSLTAQDAGAADLAERRNALGIDGPGAKASPLAPTAARAIRDQFPGPRNAAVRTFLTAALTGAKAVELAALKGERTRRPADVRKKIGRGRNLVRARLVGAAQGATVAALVKVAQADPDGLLGGNPMLAQEYRGATDALMASTPAPPPAPPASILARLYRGITAPAPALAARPGKRPRRMRDWRAVFPARRLSGAERHIGAALRQRQAFRRYEAAAQAQGGPRHS